MLVSLSIENFAIIDEVQIDFRPGMTVLSGETGAGKSIIIDALGILCGGRGSSQYIRTGADRFKVEGLFDLIEPSSKLTQVLNELGIDLADGRQLIIKREITQSGSNIIRVNNNLLNVSDLKRIGDQLVDIHGQNEHQSLLDPQAHLSLMDQFGHEELESALIDYQEKYTNYQNSRKNWLKANQDESNSVQRLEFLNFQIKEIEEAQLKPGEMEELEQVSKRLQNQQKIQDNLTQAVSFLSEGEVNMTSLLGEALDKLDQLSQVDENYKEPYERLESVRYEVEDVAHQLVLSADSEIESDLDIDQVESRLSQLQQLSRKFSMSVEEILDYYDQIGQEVYQIKNRDKYLQQVQDQFIADYQLALDSAQKLSQIRQSTSQDLTQAIESELADLYMENSRFEVEFTPVKSDKQTSELGEFLALGPNGIDQVEFYVATNLGEKVKPLVDVASGGELSRFMLALKTVFSRASQDITMVFDEIDTGVSGRVGQAIAEKIKEISTYHQVLCITHLSQVAAISNHQLLIYKETDNNRTTTNVSPLDYEQRVEVIANMMSGHELTDSSINLAREMLAKYQEGE